MNAHANTLPIFSSDRHVPVIAEIGVNHDGSLQRALDLVKIAHDCGADAVKLQVFRAGSLVHPSTHLAEYQKTRVGEPDPASMLRRYELGPAELARTIEAATQLGLFTVATPFSPSDVDLLSELDLSAVKIASPDLVNCLLLERAVALAKPLLVSTGAATLEEIDTSVGWLRRWGAGFALLHCISSYPTTDSEAHLGWIGQLRNRYSVPVGYSDHTGAEIAGALAVAAGAAFIEKHITFDRSAPGPDHSASSDPAQFATYVRLIRQAQAMHGSGEKRVLDCEKDVRTSSRQSLVLSHDMAAGAIVGRADLTVQRPGSGLSPMLIGQIVGRRTTRPISAGAMLQWDMFTDAA